MSPKCAKCGSKMDVGFILDNTHGGRIQSQWIEGIAERSMWTGVKTKGRVNLPVTTFRCMRCGYLESYALIPTAD